MRVSAELMKYERKKAISDSICEICSISSAKAWPIHSFHFDVHTQYVLTLTGVKHAI